MQKYIYVYVRQRARTKCETRNVRNPEQVPLLLAVVDGVHDLIEGKGTEEALKKSLRKAFIEGGSGTDATWIAISSASSSSMADVLRILGLNSAKLYKIKNEAFPDSKNPDDVLTRMKVDYEVFQNEEGLTRSNATYGWIRSRA